MLRNLIVRDGGKDGVADVVAVAEMSAAGFRVGRVPPLLVDQGMADSFLATQLRPERLEEACAAAGQPLTLRRHERYDHGYFFVQSFVADHLAHHARALAAG